MGSLKGDHLYHDTSAGSQDAYSEYFRTQVDGEWDSEWDTHRELAVQKLSEIIVAAGLTMQDVTATLDLAFAPLIETTHEFVEAGNPPLDFITDDKEADRRRSREDVTSRRHQLRHGQDKYSAH